MSLALYIDLEKAAVMRAGKKTPKAGAPPKISTPKAAGAGDSPDVEGPAKPKLAGPPEGSYSWKKKDGPRPPPNAVGWQQAENGTWYKMAGSGKAAQPSEEGKVDPKADIAAEKDVALKQPTTPSAEMAESSAAASPELAGDSPETQQAVEESRAAQVEEKIGDALVDAGVADKDQVAAALEKTAKQEVSDQREAGTGKEEAAPAAEKKPKKVTKTKERKTQTQKNKAERTKRAAERADSNIGTEVNRDSFFAKIKEAEEATEAGDHELADSLYHEASLELSREKRKKVETKAKDKAEAAAKEKAEKDKKAEDAANEDVKKKAARAKAREERKNTQHASQRESLTNKAEGQKASLEEKAATVAAEADRTKYDEYMKHGQGLLDAGYPEGASEHFQTAKLHLIESEQKFKKEKAATDKVAGQKRKLEQREANLDPGIDRTQYNENMKRASEILENGLPGVDIDKTYANEVAAKLIQDAEDSLSAAKQNFKQEASETRAADKEEAKAQQEEAKAQNKAQKEEAKALEKEDKELAKQEAADAKDKAADAKTGGAKSALDAFNTGRGAGEAVADATNAPGAAGNLVTSTVTAGTVGAAKLGHHLLSDEGEKEQTAAQKEDAKAGGTAQGSLGGSDSEAGKSKEASPTKPTSSTKPIGKQRIKSAKTKQKGAVGNRRINIGKSMRDVSLGQIKQILQNRGVDLAEKDYSINSVRRGAEEELEHTDDVNEATKIAIDHLEEKPHYYKRLDIAMETPLHELMELDDTKKAMNGLYIDLKKAGAVSNSSSSSAGDTSDPYQQAREYNESFSEKKTGVGAGAVPADSVAKVDEENSLQEELESAREQDAERSQRQGLTPDDEDDTEDGADEETQKGIGVDFIALANVAKVVKSINISRVTPVEMEFLTTELGYTLEDVEKGLAKITGRNRDIFSKWLCGRMHKSINVLR